MTEPPYSDEDSTPSLIYYNQNEENRNFKSILNEFLPPQLNASNGNSQIEDQISESLDQLSTNHDNNDDDDGEQFRKRARVGHHYQAKIPKYSTHTSGASSDCSSSDELLWAPCAADADCVESYLKRIASITTMLIPKGNHLRDDEEALFTLQKQNHNYESAFDIINSSASRERVKETGTLPVWSEEECRNFEQGILSFGKNFFLIKKYKVTTRTVGELVQFYYLWKKTERYDLFAARMRSGKKKYTLNPGISDLMCRYLGGQTGGGGAFAGVNADVQFVVDLKKEVSQNHNAVTADKLFAESWQYVLVLYL